jgi:hypothetical protein
MNISTMSFPLPGAVAAPPNYNHGTLDCKIVCILLQLAKSVATIKGVRLFLKTEFFTKSGQSSLF